MQLVGSVATLAHRKPWTSSQEPLILHGVAHTSISRTWDVEAGGSEAQEHPWLHSKLQDTLDLIRCPA